MSRMRWGGLGLAVILSLGVGACAGSPAGVTATSTPTAATSTGTSTTAPTLTPSATPAPTVSALGDLAAFVDAARTADSRLQAAAPLINASIQTDAVVVDERTAAAVKAIDVSAVASTIPAGMPAELMRQVLAVYSDLVSRTQAVRRFRYADRTYSRVPDEGEMGLAEGEDMVQCLANGSLAAHRFDADLAAVVTAAGSMPPLPTLDPASLAIAELEARLQEIIGRNSGCGACGGHVATRTSSIVWDDASPSATTRNGTIVYEPDPTGSSEGWGISFTATHVPGDGWTVEIHAC